MQIIISPKISKVKYLLVGFSLTLLFLWQACDSTLFDTRISEGVIEFEVTYPDMDPDNFLAGLMPDAMTMKFKDNVFNNELSAGMGMFKTNFIANSNTKNLKHSVKLVNKKYYADLSQDEVAVINKKYDSYSLIQMDEIKEIAGYTCKKALIVFDDPEVGEIYVYYTDQIHIDDANWATPFKGIDGVLLEYQLTQYDIKMSFVATAVKESDLKESDFGIQEDYEKITYDKLEKEILDIFESFK